MNKTDYQPRRFHNRQAVTSYRSALTTLKRLIHKETRLEQRAIMTTDSSTRQFELVQCLARQAFLKSYLLANLTEDHKQEANP